MTSKDIEDLIDYVLYDAYLGIFRNCPEAIREEVESLCKRIDVANIEEEDDEKCQRLTTRLNSLVADYFRDQLGWLADGERLSA